MPNVCNKESKEIFYSPVLHRSEPQRMNPKDPMTGREPGVKKIGRWLMTASHAKKIPIVLI